MKNIINRKTLILLIVLTITSMTLVACNSQSSSGDSEDLIKIEHELGEANVEENPERVVVFDYGILDILDTIDVDIVGLPKQSTPDYLEKYKSDEYTDVGSLKEPNFETIYELDPDLIIISGRQGDLYDEFEEIAPTVYLNINEGKYLDAFKNNAEVIGEIFNKEEEIEKEVNNIEEAINDLNEKAKSTDKNALFIMANDGNLSAYGLGSRFGVLYEEFGLKPVDENIDSSTHGQKISFEYIVEKDPDYIYVMDRVAVVGGDISAKQVMENDLIKEIVAYKEDNITYLDAHIWYVSSGGIYSTNKMIEEIDASLE